MDERAPEEFKLQPWFVVPWIELLLIALLVAVIAISIAVVWRHRRQG